MRFRRVGATIASGSFLVVPLATALWNHAPAMLDRIEQSDIPYPIFHEGEMADLPAHNLAHHGVLLSDRT